MANFIGMVIHLMTKILPSGEYLHTFCPSYPSKLMPVIYRPPVLQKLTSWLSLVVSNCEFVTLPLVSWVRCGT